MRKRAIAASTAALSALLLVASPAFAEGEYAGTATPIDWRLVVIFSGLGTLAFYAVLERVNRGR
jgi:hypothetical protein